MKVLFKRLKSNKGFTMQDVIVAMLILTIFAGLICGTYTLIYKIQLQTKLSSQVAVYAIQILENTDKISYDEVTNGMEEHYRTEYNIPNTINLKMKVNNYNTQNTIKQIRLTISYEFQGETDELVMEKFKAKEI